MFYVAITRVTNKENLFLRSFDRRHIQHSPRVEYEIETMKNSKQYMMRKIYCDEEVFTEEEMKIGYLNLNGLLFAGHTEYINEDPNLLSLDLLAIGETHLTSTIPNNVVQRKLESIFTSQARCYQWNQYGLKKQMNNMGILVLGSRKSNLLQKYNLEHDDSLEKGIPNLGTFSMPGIHGLKCQLEQHTFAFVYSRNPLNHANAQVLLHKTSDIDYLLGDLNLSVTNPNHAKAIEIICDKSKRMLLTELTTKHNKQLDHILGKDKDNISLFTTAFKNLATDHKAIVITISKSGSAFLSKNINSFNSQHSSAVYQPDEDDIIVTKIAKKKLEKSEYDTECVNPLLINQTTISEYYVTHESTDQFKSITPFMDRVIDQILQDNDRTLPIVEHFNILITRKDIEKLEGLHWINDEIINFYMNMIVRRSTQQNFPNVWAF